MFKKILKIKLKIIGSIVVLLLLVQLISAYFFGIIAKGQIDNQFQHLTNSSLITVVSRNYSRGWFSSEESVVISVNNQLVRNLAAILPGSKESSIKAFADNSYLISYQSHISHGLLAGWLHGNIMPTIAYVNTKFIFPERMDKILKKFFVNKEALEIENIIYFNKSGKYVVYSPGFNYDEALSGVKVSWGGLYLKVNYNQAFNQFNNDLLVPRFEMDAPTKGDIALTDFSYTSNSSYSKNNIKIGTATLKLSSLKVALAESNSIGIKFGEVVHMLIGINSADFLNGIDAINPTNFQISNVNYNSVSTDKDNFFSARARAGFESLVTNGKKYGPMNFDLTLAHISSPEFSLLMDYLNTMAGLDQTDENSREKTIAMLKTYFTPIFVKEPEVILNELSLVTPEGKVYLTGKATTTNFESGDMSKQDEFMKKLSVNITFSVPKPILAYFFVLQMKYFLTAGNAQMDEQSSEALTKVVNILLDNQLHVWLKKGYLKQDESIISSSISLESGVVLLNGIPTKH